MFVCLFLYRVAGLPLLKIRVITRDKINTGPRQGAAGTLSVRRRVCPWGVKSVDYRRVESLKLKCRRQLGCV